MSTNNSFQGSGTPCEPLLLLGSSTAGLCWRITLSSLVCFSPGCGEAFTLHLSQTTRSFIFTCDSCSARVRQPVPPLCLRSRTDTVSAGVSASALKSSILQETVEQVPRAVLGLSADVPFEDWFNASSFCVRKEGMFTGIEITTSFYLSWIWIQKAGGCLEVFSQPSSILPPSPSHARVPSLCFWTPSPFPPILHL